MAGEPETLVFAGRHEFRGIPDRHSGGFGRRESRVRHIGKPVDDLSKDMTFSLGQSPEAAFMQSHQDGRIDELFGCRETLPSEPAP